MRYSPRYTEVIDEADRVQQDKGAIKEYVAGYMNAVNLINRWRSVYLSGKDSEVFYRNFFSDVEMFKENPSNK